MKLATKISRQQVKVTQSVNVKINIPFFPEAPGECLHGRRPISAVFGAGN